MFQRNGAEAPRLTPQPITASYYPDFAGGLCTTERGQRIARDAVTNETSLKAIKARKTAKLLCNVGPCPIRDMCRVWVLSQENPVGSWSGVWGGLDPWNRRGLELIIRDGKAEVIEYDIDRALASGTADLP